MRVESAISLLNRHRGLDSRSTPGGGVDQNRPPHLLGPLAHSTQSIVPDRAERMLGIESASIVADAQTRPVRIALELEIDTRRLTVPHRVGDRLLADEQLLLIGQ